MATKDESLNRFQFSKFSTLFKNNEPLSPEKIAEIDSEDEIFDANKVMLDAQSMLNRTRMQATIVENTINNAEKPLQKVGSKRGPKDSLIMDGTRAQRTTAIKIMVKPEFSKRCKIYCFDKGMTLEELGYQAIMEYLEKNR